MRITATTAWTEPERVHNLTVAGLHTYYVLAGDRAILVHNADPCDEANNIANHANERFMEGALDHRVSGVPANKLADYVDDILEGRRTNVDSRYRLRDGRSAHYDNDTGAVVIEDPNAPHSGTVFTPQRGRDYFDDLE